MKFDAALERQTQRLERAHRKGEGCKVGLADGRGAPVDIAVFYFSAVGVATPAFAGRHHVAVRIQCDGPAGAIGAAHDQVGQRFQPVGLDLGGGHRVFFGFEAESLEQFGRAFGMRRIVAGRRRCGNTDQFLQEAHFFVEVGIDPGVQLVVCGHGASVASWFKRC
jgi:hypothetical protein